MTTPTTVTTTKQVYVQTEAIQKILVAHYVALGVIPEDTKVTVSSGGDWLPPVTLSWTLAEDLFHG